MSFYKKIRKSIMLSVILFSFGSMFAAEEDEVIQSELTQDQIDKINNAKKRFKAQQEKIRIENARRERDSITQNQTFLTPQEHLTLFDNADLMKPEDLSTFDQRSIKTTGTNIANIPLDTFKTLSESQTAALTPAQIRAIAAKPEYLKALKTEYISPVTMYEVIKDSDNLITNDARNTLISKTTSAQADYMLNQPSLKLSPDLWSVLKKRESYFNSLSRKIRTGTVQSIQRARDTIKTIPSKLSENANTALTNELRTTNADIEQTRSELNTKPIFQRIQTSIDNAAKLTENINEVKQKTQPRDVIQFLNDYAAKKSELENQIEQKTITPPNKKFLQEMPSLLAAIKPNALLSAINSIGDDGAETILKDVSAEQADYILNNDPELSAAYKEVLEARESYLNKFGRKAREAFGTTSKAVASSAQTVKEKLNATKKQFSDTASKAVDAINDSLNKNRDYQEARRLIKKDSTSTLDPEEQTALEKHITKLTTKEKERILNELTQENDIKIYNLNKQKAQLLTKLAQDDTTVDSTQNIDSMSLNAEIRSLQTHSLLIRQTIERSLTPNEVLMPLVVDGSKYPTYDIVDMSQINPADPDFAKALDKVASVHFLPNGREGRMDATTLANNYYTWIADKITPDDLTTALTTASSSADETLKVLRAIDKTIRDTSATIASGQPLDKTIELNVIKKLQNSSDMPSAIKTILNRLITEKTPMNEDEDNL